jgi:hypothetical protein
MLGSGCVHGHGEEHCDVDLWRRCYWRKAMKLCHDVANVVTWGQCVIIDDIDN